MSIPLFVDGETELDAATLNRLRDAVLGSADYPIALAGIVGALGERDSANGITNVLDILVGGGTLQDAIDEGGTTYFPNRGTPYEIDTPLLLPAVFDLRGEEGATITATTAMAAVLRRDTTAQVTDSRSRISQLTIDCNELADVGILIERGNYIDLSDIQVTGFLDSGIDIGSANYQTYELTGRRIRLIGPYASGGVLGYTKPAYGLYLGADATDNSFAQVIVKNVTTCFYDAGRGNWYDQCHAYGWEETEASPDYGFRVPGSANFFSQCYADGPQVAGFLFEGSVNVADTCFVLWGNENPPVSAVGFKATANNYTFSTCSVSASQILTLASTNIDYEISSWDGNIIAPISRLTHVGGSHFGRSIVKTGLQSQGLRATSIGAVSATKTVEDDEHVITVDCTAASVTINLVAASWLPGRELVVKRIDNSGNSVILDANGTDLIDGAATKTITTQYGFLAIVSDGTDWQIVAQGGTIT